jgi:hypothetical protein
LGLVGYGFVFKEEGALGVEKLAGDVGKDGSAAWGDAAFGDEGEEADEEITDVSGGVVLGGSGEEVGGEVFRVVLDGNGNGSVETFRGVSATKARVIGQAWEAAALAVGIDEGTARGSGSCRESDRIGEGGGANGCGVHWFFLF